MRLRWVDGTSGEQGMYTCTISTRSCAIILPHYTSGHLRLIRKRGSELDLLFCGCVGGDYL